MAHHGMTVEDLYNSQTDDEAKKKYGEKYSDEVFDKFMIGEFYNGWEEYESSETNCFTINNNEYGKPGVAELRRIVGLTGDFDYDPKAIEDVQQGRYAAMDPKMLNPEDDDKKAEESEEMDEEAQQAYVKQVTKNYNELFGEDAMQYESMEQDKSWI